jgi:hypothetical protein
VGVVDRVVTRAKISSPRENQKPHGKNCANLASNMDPKASPPQFEGYAAHPVSSAGAGFDALFAAIDASCGASPSREPASKALLVGGQHTRVAVGPSISAGSGLGNARTAPAGGAAVTTTSPAPHPAWRPAQAGEGASSGKRQPAQDCSSSSEGGSDGSTTHGQRAKTPRGATTTARPRAPARAAPTRTPPKPESPETPEYNEDEEDDDDDGVKAPFALRPLASVPVPPLDRDSKKKLPPALRQVNITPPSPPPSLHLSALLRPARSTACHFLSLSTMCM